MDHIELDNTQLAEYTYDWESLIGFDGKLLWVNRSVERITGYSVEECYHMDSYPLPIVHSKDSSWMINFLSKLSADYSGNDHEIRIVNREGKIIYTALSWQSMPDNSGKLIGVRLSIREISYRKSIEDLTKLTEQFYRMLFEESIDMVIIYGFNGKILDFNRRAVENLGYTRKELLSKYMSQIIGDDETINDSVVETIRKRKNYLYQTTFKHSDGTVIPVEIQAQIQEYGYAQVIAAFVRDITTRKKIEKDLERSLMFSNSLLNAIPIPVFYKDREGRYLGCNNQFTEFFGKSSDDIVGKTVEEVWPQNEATIYHQKDMEELQTEGPQIYEHTVKDKNGTTHHVMFIKNVYRDEENTISGLIGAILDVTDRKRYEMALATNEEYFRTMIDTVQAGIMLVDFHTLQIARVNKLAVETIGLPEDKIIGRYCYEFFSVKHKGACPIHNSMENNHSSVSDEYLYIVDGSKIPVHRSATKIVILGKEYVLESFIDMTHRKILEDELRNTSKELEKALQVKSTFISTLSHEIRTPLNSIVSLNHLLKESGLMQNQLQYVNRMENSSKLLLDLLNNILDLSKIESGRLHINKSVFCIDDIIDEVLSAFSSLAYEKKIRLYFVRDENAPFYITGDSLRIEQILMNLISNALKFTDEGSVTLDVAFKNMFDQSPSLVFKVIDTGIGIEKETAQNLFQPFYQADASITRNYGGSGLGLSISAQLAHKLEGTLSVESVIGQGSTFTLELPVDLTEESFVYPYTMADTSISTALFLAEDSVCEKYVSFHLSRCGINVEFINSFPDKEVDIVDADLLITSSADVEKNNLWEPLSIVSENIPVILLQNTFTPFQFENINIITFAVPLSAPEFLRTVIELVKHGPQKNFAINSIPLENKEEEVEQIQLSDKEIELYLKKLHSSLRQDLAEALASLDKIKLNFNDENKESLEDIENNLRNFKIQNAENLVEKLAEKLKLSITEK
jgi:PAS domain S-box-containing protein